MLDFQNHLGKTLYSLLEQCLLDEEGIQVINRPLYHSKYKFTLGMSLDYSWWSSFFEIKQELTTLLEKIPNFGHFHSNSTTLSFYLYSNNPETLRVLIPYTEKVKFGFLHIVDKASWDRILPTPKPKSKFYHTYNFRIRFSRSFNGPQLESDYNKLRGAYMWSHTYPNMFYVQDARDMMLLKLLYSDDILDIEDRSDFPG